MAVKMKWEKTCNPETTPRTNVCAQYKQYMRLVDDNPVLDDVCSETVDNNEFLCEALAMTEAGLKQSRELIIGNDKCETNLDGDSLKDFPVEYIFSTKKGLSITVLHWQN